MFTNIGVKGAEHFVNKEPLRTVHEWAFGVLGLGSEPVDVNIYTPCL
jgi:hypothetical protein